MSALQSLYVLPKLDYQFSSRFTGTYSNYNCESISFRSSKKETTSALFFEWFAGFSAGMPSQWNCWMCWVALLDAILAACPFPSSYDLTLCALIDWDWVKHCSCASGTSIISATYRDEHPFNTTSQINIPLVIASALSFIATRFLYKFPFNDPVWMKVFLKGSTLMLLLFDRIITAWRPAVWTQWSVKSKK